MDTSKIQFYAEIGKSDKDWYHKNQLVFEDLFGTEKLHLVCSIFAATSINTSLKSNITLFRKAYYEIENNLPIGNYLPNIQSQLQRIRTGQELSGRKIRSFAKAMSGDSNAVVVDVWLLRAFNLDRQHMRHSGPHKGHLRSGGPTDRQYTLIEAYVREQAAVMGIQPRQLSSMIWAGARIAINGDRETTYSNILKNKLTNLFNVI